LSFTWSTATLLRRPRLASLGYWVLQNAALVAGDRAAKRPQRIEFSPLNIKPTSLSQPHFDPAWPADLPLPAQLALGQVTPAGWQGAAVDASASSSDAVVQVLRVQKKLEKSGAVASWTIRFSAAGRVLESDLAKATATAREGIAPADADMRSADEEMRQLRQSAEPGIKDLQQRLADWKQPPAPGATNPQAQELTPEQIRQEIDLLNRAIQARQSELDEMLTPLLIKKKEATDRAAGCRETVAAYEELKEVELVVELPQGLEVGRVRLRRD
jgi:hypothetical protein